MGDANEVAENMSRTTMADVAKAAGVSQKSVSRVINKEPNVTAKLRSKVESAIAALGFVPDLAARSLAAGRHFTIGILFPDWGQVVMVSYEAMVQLGARRACRSHDYHLLVEHVQVSEDGFAMEPMQSLDTMRVDGLLLTPPLVDDTRLMDILEARKIPFVRMAPSTDFDRAPYLAIDDVTAGAEVAQYLWELGHRRFGYVGGVKGQSAASGRQKGYIEALSHLGGTHFLTNNTKLLFELGMEAAYDLMGLAHPPTAIFTINDEVAAGVIAGLSQLGLKVPDDVSVVGFDNSWIATSVWPYLTTVHQPTAQMAEMAINMLIDRDPKRTEARAINLDYQLVIRGSTAPPKRG